jgi:hypothetical protein
MIYAVLKFNGDLEIYLFETDAPPNSERFDELVDVFDTDKKSIIVMELDRLKQALSHAEFRFDITDGKAYR